MRFRSAALTVVIFAVAMSFVESAAVVYLQRALGINPDELFPLRSADVVGSLAAIEVGREAATLVMLVAIGCLAGRGRVDRFAWTAVAFGVWDIGYYVWLWVFIGWPHGLGTWDVLFLIPTPWTGPVWAPVAVSAALIGFGLAAAYRTRAGSSPRIGRVIGVAAVMGGVIVVMSFLANGPAVLDGGLPGWFPWPVFWLGMATAAVAAVAALREGAGVSSRITG
jgi:hypothetical protein